MKTKMLLRCACLVAGLSFFTVSCDKNESETSDTTLSINPTSISVTKKGGTFNLAVTSNANWTTTISDPNMASVTPTASSKNRDITLTVEQNTDPEERTATITFTAGTKTETVTVTQAGAGIPGAVPSVGTYIVSKDSYRITNADGTIFSDEYQGNFNEDNPNEVTLTQEDNNYLLSDLFGGFYVPGRDPSSGYNENDHVCWGILHFADGKFTLIEGKSDSWEIGWKTDLLLESSYDGAEQTITLVIPWGTDDETEYTFHLLLIKKEE